MAHEIQNDQTRKDACRSEPAAIAPCQLKDKHADEYAKLLRPKKRDRSTYVNARFQWLLVTYESGKDMLRIAQIFDCIHERETAYSVLWSFSFQFSGFSD